jgi:hypothetical protein
VYQIDSIAAFDVDKIEHCVFDRVHLEARATRTKIASTNTSFLELYNKAVETTGNAGDLKDDIKQIAPADLRAKFSKSTYTSPDLVWAWMWLHAEWDGGKYMMPETGAQAPTALDDYRAVVSAIGMVMEAQWESTWVLDDGSGGGIGGIPAVPSFDDDHPHIRFADPLVIDQKQKE